MNQFKVKAEDDLLARKFAIKTWEKSFHENIMELGRSYNNSRVKGSKRFSVAIKSSFVFFAKLADAELSKLSEEALYMTMNENSYITVQINRNQAARAKCNDYSINTIKNHIDSMCEIGMVIKYDSYYRVGHKRMYRLRLSKKWLSIAFRAEMSDFSQGNGIPSASSDKSCQSISNGPKQQDLQKNAIADYQEVSTPKIQTLTTIYNKKNISNRYNSNNSKGEDKSSSPDGKSVTRFTNFKKNDEGSYEKFSSGQNPQIEKNKFSSISPGRKKDLVLKPNQSHILNSKKSLKLRFARNLWQQCRTTIFKSMTFTSIQDEQYTNQLMLHMDNMQLEANYSKLFDHKPEIIEIYNSISQAITLAASFQDRTGKSGQKFVFWLKMFLDLEIDLMNGDLKNKKYLSLQKWTYEFLPKTWEKNKEKLQRGSIKWEEQRIRLYINQVFEDMLNFAIKHDYTSAELNDKKWKNRNYVMRKLNNSILSKDTNKNLLKLYDLRVVELDKL